MRILIGTAALAAMTMLGMPETAAASLLIQDNGRGRDKPAQASQAQRNSDKPKAAQAQRNDDRGRPAQAQGNQRPQQAQPRNENRPQQANPGRANEARGNPGKAAARGNDERANAASGRSAGNSAAAGRSNGRLERAAVRERVRDLPVEIRRLDSSNRYSDRVVVDATARGMVRGLASDRIRVRRENDRVNVLNNRGDLLFHLGDNGARELGAWQTRRVNDTRNSGNAPAFCRSGAGHPVWGREWCLEKGFGLGSGNGTIWGRTTVEDVVFGRRTDRDRLDRGGLVDVLGDIVFGRLAVHALTLGYDQPLSAVWVAEPDSPRLLRVHSGDYPVAELIDTDRDDRADILFVVHRQ